MDFVQIDSSMSVSSAQQSIQWLNIDNTVSIIAITLGLSVFVMAYFAGGRENISRIIFSVVLSSLVGFFAMPLFLKVGEWLGILEMPYGQVIMTTIIVVFVAALAANAYEIVTVSAREARPPQ